HRTRASIRVGRSDPGMIAFDPVAEDLDVRRGVDEDPGAVDPAVERGVEARPANDVVADDCVEARLVEDARPPRPLHFVPVVERSDVVPVGPEAQAVLVMGVVVAYDGIAGARNLDRCGVPTRDRDPVVLVELVALDEHRAVAAPESALSVVVHEAAT